MADQLKFDLGSSEKALHHLHNAMKEMHLAMAELTAPPGMTDEKPVKPAKRQANPWHMPIKTHFLSYYKTEKGVKYYFTPKDGAAVNRIINKLEFVISEIGVVHRQGIDIDVLWQNVLRRLKEDDPWVYENLSLSIIDSKLVGIISKIKNDKGDDYKQELLNRMS